VIVHDKKKEAMIILSKMHKDGSETSQKVRPEVQMNEKDQTLQAIAEDMLHAFEQKSAAGLVSAMKAFMSECEGSEEPELE
jgi:hypothetical protein